MDNDRIEYLKKDYVQGFPAYCGFQVERVADGIFESRLNIRPEHQQQDGFVHAGVIATLLVYVATYVFDFRPEQLAGLASSVLIGIIFVGLNLLSDLLYKLVDPRARLA